jgi:hypothetical protein
MRPPPNAGAHLLPEAGATHERTLEAVRCSALILIEAPSSADPRGLLALGQRPKQAEETPGDSPPSHTRFPVASTCTLGPWSLGLLNQAGEGCLHRHLTAAPEPFLTAVAP